MFIPKTKIMRCSLIACVVLIVISAFAERIIAGLLYELAHPILNLVFSSMPDDINAWSADSIDPVLMTISMIWAFGFLIAARVYLYLESLEWTNMTIKTCYVVILLFWNLLIWITFMCINLQGK